MAEGAQPSEDTLRTTAPLNQPWWPSDQKRHPLSCTLCRQRKIKCDKIHPCGPCKRAERHCVFPERARPARKKRDDPKTSNNNDLLRRLGRMEELIEKMKVEGQNGPKITQDQSPNGVEALPAREHISAESRSEENGPDKEGDGTTRYIGSAFFRSLTSEVEGIKQTMDDVSDEEATPDPAHTPPDTQSPPAAMLFGSSPTPANELRLLHPHVNEISTLCNIYIENCDPMAKILHIPSLRNTVSQITANAETIPPGTSEEALLFAMYYAAITSLTDDQCLQLFMESRVALLAKYKKGTEAALANANMLLVADIGILEALMIYLSSARTNDDSLLTWTLSGMAIRLGHGLGLHRENSKARISPSQMELRRRLWWQLIYLDMRCSEDRGTDPLILPGSFNTRRPLNIHDSDMDLESMEPLVERREFTAMTKTHLSHLFWNTAMRINYVFPTGGFEENTGPTISFEEKTALVDQLEAKLENEVLSYCNPANPLEWCTSVVMRLIMARLRLAVYHPPMHDDRSPSHHLVNRDDVLTTAVKVLEHSHLLDCEPAVAKWSWHFRTHVQWHALATVLAELCVRNSGTLVDRAWKIVDTVFDDWAARIADSKSGMLWRPIKKLMCKAQSKRNERKASTDTMEFQQQQQQQPLPQGPSYGPLQDKDFGNVSYHPDSVLGFAHKHQLDQGLSSDIMSSLTVNDTGNTINWAEWDDFMKNLQMTDPAAVDGNTLQQDISYNGPWW